MPKAGSIVWFRDDLRISDHSALAASSAAGALLCIYLFDEETPGPRPLGGAAKWWLHHSLASLTSQLNDIGARLDLLVGPAEKVIVDVAIAAGVASVRWSRRYGGAERRIDRAVADALQHAGIEAHEHEGTLLHDPARLKPASGPFYRVFTPFWKTLRATSGEFGSVGRAPSQASAMRWPASAPRRVSLPELQLLPKHPDWAGGLREAWTPGAPAAHAQLSLFLRTGIFRYAAQRDAPAIQATSRLSPRLRFGELSPRQVWRATEHAAESRKIPSADVTKFLSEIAWREFSYHLYFHAPDLARQNFDRSFDSFAWRDRRSKEVSAWRRGQTGFPLVDAGLRELWRTGYMHNRVRLVVASFLVKDLLIDWRVGEEWFWDTLCDADPANNPANWQWSAGSGADAAPYFRIFNPTLQSRKFDPSGHYIRRWAPELRDLPAAWIHEPAACPENIAAPSGVELGKTYPHPIVDHARARERALQHLKAAKGSS